MGKRWTPYEKDWLRINYNQLSRPDLKRLTGRSWLAITSMASKLGLKRDRFKERRVSNAENMVIILRK